MTDRELLEMAAKACGYKQVAASYHSDDDGFPTSEFWYLHVKDLYDGKSGDSCIWNPLTDDGDRYRLARACKLRIDFQDGRVFGPYEICYSFTPGNVAEEAYAIVRAAAEIGKEMP